MILDSENVYSNVFDKILKNSMIKKIRGKIKLISNNEMTNSFPENYSASLKVKFNNGITLNKLNTAAKGDPENPMTDREICDKAINLIRNKNCNPLIKKIINTDEANDHAPITWFDDLQEII